MRIALVSSVIFLSACTPVVLGPAIVIGENPEDESTKLDLPSDPPVETEPMPVGGPDDKFGRRWAAIALGRAANEAMLCWRPGDLAGPAHVRVTFALDGKASNVVLDGPLAEGRSAACVYAAFRATAVPQYGGGREVTVGKSLVLHDPTGDGSPAFSPEAAKRALATLSFKPCSSIDGPAGTGDVLVNFAPDGTAVAAKVDNGAFAGTNVGACVEGLIRKNARIPTYEGGVRWIIVPFRVPEPSAESALR